MPHKKKKVVIGVKTVGNIKFQQRGGSQSYSVLCKRDEIPDRKFMCHSSEQCFGFFNKKDNIQNNIRGSLGKQDGDVKKFYKAKKNWKRQLRSLENQNKVLYSMINNLGSRKELHNINHISTKGNSK